MTTQIFLWLVAAILVGVVLVALGWRGRRVNSRPCCKQCGFDLTGVIETGTTCPECGSGIKLEKFVRVGQRKRIYPLVALGLPLVVLPLIPLAVVLFATVTRSDLAKYKPVSLLLWEARNLERADAAKAVAELLSRQRGGSLGDAEYKQMLETMVAAQRDAARPWVGEWGDVAFQARMDGRMDKAAVEEFNAGAAVLRWACRSVVRAGADVPIVGTLVDKRLMASVSVKSWHRVESVKLAGRALREPNSEIPQDPQSLLAIGDGDPVAEMGETDDGVVHDAVAIPADLAPGEYELEVTVVSAAGVYDRSTFFDSGVKPETREVRSTLRFPVRVVPAEERVVTLLPETTEASAQLAKQLDFAARASDEWNDSRFEFTFSLAASGKPLAHRAWFKVGEERFYLGPVTTGHGLKPPEEDADFVITRPDAAGRSSLLVKYRIGMVEDEGTLILEPAPDLAELTTDLTEIYGGRIEMRSVQLSETADGGVVAFAHRSAAEANPQAESDK
jgi:hypothetical protein